MKDSFIAKFSMGFIKKSRVTFLLFLTILLLGYVSYSSLLKREGFPSIDIPFAIVQTPYFVGDANQVDQDVTRPIETVVGELGEIAEVTSSTSDNFSVVIAEFGSDVTSQEGAKLLEDTITADLLPEGTEYQVVTIDASKFLGEYDILLNVLSNDDLTVTELQEKADILGDELEESNRISKAETIDLISEQINPITGETIDYQSGFNRYGKKEGDKLEFSQAVAIGLVKKGNIDSIEFSEEVKSQLTKIEEEGGTEGLEVVFAADFSKDLTSQLQNLESNFVSGLIAVLVVLFFFINWRASLTTIIFIPTVMLATFFSLYLIGYSLNVISLFALILVLGLFVDDAIVVVEAIDFKKKEGLKGIKAVASAINDIGPADVSGTITTILVFLPMVFTSGILGEFIRAIPITVIIALIISLITALSIIPFFSNLIINDRSAKEERKGYRKAVHTLLYGFTELLEKLAGLNSRLIKKYLSSKIFTALVVVFSFIFIGVGLFFSSFISFSIFPSPKDTEAVVMTVGFPAGTEAVEAEEIAKEVEQLILPKYEDIITTVTYFESTNSSASAQIDLVPMKERGITSKQMIDDLKTDLEEYSRGRAKLEQSSAGPPTSEFPFAMQVFADDQETLEALSTEISDYLKTLELENDQEILAVVIDNLETIAKIDNSRYVEVKAKITNPENTATVIEIRDLVEEEFDEDRLSEYSLTESALGFDFGQESENIESFTSAVIALVLAMVMMYGLLVYLYDSYLQPLLVFSAIPLAFPGLFPGLYYTDNAISFFVMLGLIGLVGIVVNNTIMLLDYINQARAEGMSISEAASRAVRIRFRPILTTSTTTIAGLFPLAISDPFWEGLSYSIIFGLISSSILVLIVFPAYYAIVEKLRILVRKPIRALLKK